MKMILKSLSSHVSSTWISRHEWYTADVCVCKKRRRRRRKRTSRKTRMKWNWEEEEEEEEQQKKEKNGGQNFVLRTRRISSPFSIHIFFFFSMCVIIPSVRLTNCCECTSSQYWKKIPHPPPCVYVCLCVYVWKRCPGVTFSWLPAHLNGKTFLLALV